MTNPVVTEIIRGESFTLELRLTGEDLTGAVPSLQIKPGVPEWEFTFEVLPPYTLILHSASSLAFLLGQHNAQIWLDWPDGQREVILDFIIAVNERVELPPIDIIIDGGTADSVYDESIDGGEE